MKSGKKVISLLLCGVLLLAAGCTKEDSSSVESVETTAATAETTETTTTLVTEVTVSPDRDRTEVNVETEHILDDAEVLDAETYAALNERAAWLARTFRIRVCVVIADTLGGAAPADYAKACFAELYPGSADGALLLINNEGGEDYFYMKGTVKQHMADLSELILARISRDLAEGNYRSAVEYAFGQIELSCPEHIFDESGYLAVEEVAAIEAAGDNAASDDRSFCVILTEDAVSAASAKEYLTEQYGDDSAALLLVNPVEETVAAALGGTLRDSVSNTALGATLDRVEAALKKESVGAACGCFFESVADFSAA